MALVLDTAFEPRHGRPVQVGQDITLLTAPNPGPFTFTGTNTYVVGGRDVAVIDPGPDLAAHHAALRSVLAGRRVSHILVSHTHRDHSPLARKLKNETGATVLAEGPHRAARPSWAGRAFSLDGSADTEFRADARLADGDVVAGNGWALRAVLTPGHAVNHACFALEEQRILFSGDHVMGWSTTVVALPDGNMGDYMRSLEKLIARDDRLLLPGHGGPVKEPQAFLRGLKAHRRQRERSILERLKSGDRTVPAIVACLYPTIGPELRQAAAAMVLAHLDGLVERGLAKVAGPPGLAALFEAN